MVLIVLTALLRVSLTEADFVNECVMVENAVTRRLLLKHQRFYPLLLLQK